MKPAFLLPCLFVLAFTSSCTTTPQQAKTEAADSVAAGTVNTEKIEPDGQPAVSAAFALKNVQTFSAYTRAYLELWDDFDAYDDKKNKITRPEFFGLIATGNYFPVRLRTGAVSSYELFRMSPAQVKAYSGWTEYWGRSGMQYEKMKGSDLPNFHFTDMNGNVYTPENTKGKTLVIKTWFIRCRACNLEMPQLNQVVTRYSNRKDVLFISLAEDDKKDLEKFLEKTAFNYETVPSQHDYIEKRLNLNVYPTHLIVDAKGKIRAVTSEGREVEAALEKILRTKTAAGLPGKTNEIL